MGYKKRVPEVRVKLCEAGYMYSAEPICKPEDIVRLLASEMKDLDREMIYVVNLDTRNRPLNVHCVSMGGLSTNMVEMANVFKTAILSNAKSILMAHNHPSGDVSPSKEDFAVTRRVKEAGELLGITLLDHVVIGNGYYSFKENCTL